MTYYLDNDYRVHMAFEEGYLTWVDENKFFEGKCEEFIEGYRVVPEGHNWTREDGIQFEGLMIAPFIDYVTLSSKQHKHEKATLKQNREIMDVAASLLTDKQALAVPALFREWEPDIDYIVDERRLHNHVLYRCLTAHTAQETWTPDVSPSLWAEVLIPEENVIPAWKQPDSTNTYKIGDKVTHNGKIWVSSMDNNSWEPGIYGWIEIGGEE